MRIYFDEEFTGLHKCTTLISIGLISDNGDTFYAELTDYDKSQVDKWIDDNVIKNLSRDENDLKLFATTTIKGNKFEVAKVLNTWLNKFKSVEWVSDVCHYDFVLLIDLLYGNALSMPKNISAVCHDINQDIASYYEITDMEAFNKNRESIISNISSLTKAKHNSMWDARVICAIYKKIKLGIHNFESILGG